MSHRTVIFDFDGTIALGNGPLAAYVDCLEDIVGTAIAEHCRAAVSAFDSGLSDARDAYDAVQRTATDAGVTRAQLSSAYLASRALLATDRAPIHAPSGMRDFLLALRGAVRCVLVTNAPAVGLDRALRSLAVADLIDEMHADTGKPAGLTPIVAEHLATGPVLSVGDIWANDLAPAAALGADTALVGVASDRGEPTMVGATLTDLYPEILAWAGLPRAETSSISTTEVDAATR